MGDGLGRNSSIEQSSEERGASIVSDSFGRVPPLALTPVSCVHEMVLGRIGWGSNDEGHHERLVTKARYGGCPRWFQQLPT